MKMKMLLQKGISLLEVMLSLSIIAIILVMATRYFFVASSSQNVNKMRRQVSALNSAVAGWKIANATYTPLNTDGVKAVADAGHLAKSSDYDATAGVLSNPWGAPITLAATATTYTVTSVLGNANDCNSLVVSFPSATCGADGKTFTLVGGAVAAAAPATPAA